MHTTITKMFIKISILLLLVAFNLTTGENQSISCGSDTVICICGIGASKRYETLELKIKAVEDSTTGKFKCDGHLDPYQACANISCLLSSNNSDSYVKTNDVLSYFYPQVFSIPPGGLPDGHRFRRQIKPCEVTPLKNAGIKCWKWPNWMNCDINCIYGYALQDETETVTTKNVNCRDSENVWKPQGFQDCKPFLNCKVKLVMPGKMKCKEPLDSPAYCEISCLDYGDYEATDVQKYECVDGTFERGLPHCAALQKEGPLVPKPQ